MYFTILSVYSVFVFFLLSVIRSQVWLLAMGYGTLHMDTALCIPYWISSCCSNFHAFDHLPLFAAQAPHFSRLGEVEVNAGQNATFQCPAAGRANEGETFLLQVFSVS